MESKCEIFGDYVSYMQHVYVQYVLKTLKFCAQYVSGMWRIVTHRRLKRDRDVRNMRIVCMRHMCPVSDQNAIAKW